MQAFFTKKQKRTSQGLPTQLQGGEGRVRRYIDIAILRADKGNNESGLRANVSMLTLVIMWQPVMWQLVLVQNSFGYHVKGR